jgi:hypothetical protein
MKIRATYHYGSHRDVRTITASDWESASMVAVIRRGAVYPPYITDVMGERMARELRESGRCDLGWMTYEVVSS